MLPDALARLQAQYDQLVDDVEAGNIPFEQATASLAQMVVVDGAGAHWSIDVNGTFTVAAGPGQPPQAADPAQFAADRLPPRADAQDVPPWNDPHLMGGGGLPASGAPWPGAAGQPDPGMGPGPMPAHVDPRMGRAKHLGDDPDDSVVARVKHAVGGGTSAGAKLLSKLPGDKRTVAVIGAGVALLVAVFVFGKLTTDPLENVDGSGIPVAGDTTAPTGDTTAAPAPGGDFPGGDSGTAPAGTVPVAGLPSAEDGNRIVGALTSGDRQLAAGVLTVNGGKANTALQVASLSGLDDAQVVLTAGPATESNGGVQARFVLADAVDGTEYAQAIVTWVAVDGGWKLQTWPQWSHIE